jgi:hypothetical protein
MEVVIIYDYSTVYQLMTLNIPDIVILWHEQSFM